MADRVFTIERLNWRRAAAGWLVLPGTDRVGCGELLPWRTKTWSFWEAVVVDAERMLTVE
jgi:hypothetical protein